MVFRDRPPALGASASSLLEHYHGTTHDIVHARIFCNRTFFRNYSISVSMTIGSSGDVPSLKFDRLAALAHLNLVFDGRGRPARAPIFPAGTCHHHIAQTPVEHPATRGPACCPTVGFALLAGYFRRFKAFPWKFSPSTAADTLRFHVLIAAPPTEYRRARPGIALNRHLLADAMFFAVRRHAFCMVSLLQPGSRRATIRLLRLLLLI